MSKLAREPFSLPEEVTVEERNGALIFKGPEGELILSIPSEIEVAKVDGALKVEGKSSRICGLYAALLRNAIQGVHEGFRKELELVGVGYKVEKAGDVLKLSLGFSHPVEYKVREDVKVTVEGGTRIIVGGVDRQKVGQVAAEIRKLRPPEPYKGKGIRYVGEKIRRKRGKVTKAMAGGV